MFAFAGTKDRQAKTSQLMTAYRVEAERLAALNQMFCKRRIGIRLGNFTYRERPVRLGLLGGNRFAIVVREVRLPPLLQQRGDLTLSAHIEQCVRALRECGFANYFGRQRFGSWSVPTPLVGRELLHSRWSSAVDLLLRASEPNPNPNPNPTGSSSASNPLKHKLTASASEGKPVACKQAELDEVVPDNEERAEADAQSNAATAEAADDTTRAQRPRAPTALERKLFDAVRECGRTLQALQQLPRSVRLLYLHSYQSLVWNRVLSRRLREVGARLLAGDLVLPRTSASSSGACEPATDACGRDDPEAEAEAEDEVDADAQNAGREPLVVSKEELDARKYSFFDLVLPLPGYRIRLPENQST